MNAKRMLTIVAIALLTVLIAVACGSTETDTGGAEGGTGVMRFTFSPDPVWDYLKDNGIKEEMEIACDLRILDSPTWDEFGIYAGGHADVVSVGSFEVPILNAEAGQESVVFGKYNIDRSIVVAPAGSSAETLDDLRGEKIAVWDTVSSTMIWGILAQELHDVDFRTDGGDYELVLADITNTAALVASGEVAGALILPDFSVPQLTDGSLKILYDGRTAADMYAEVVDNPSHEGPMINIFMATKEYYDGHPDEIACFMSIWERGIQEWQANKADIIASYPQHFAVETPEEIAFMQDYLANHDWFVSSVYLDDDWVSSESEIFDLMRDTGFMEDDVDNPTFDPISP